MRDQRQTVTLPASRRLPLFGLASLAIVAMPVHAATSTGACDGGSAGAADRRFALTAVMAATATKLELQGMQRSESWHMAAEPSRTAVIGDPSSHLHSLGSYKLARSAAASFAARDCDAVNSHRAALAGAAVSLTMGVAKEVIDGWYNGFSPSDLSVDAMGAGFAVAQSFVPTLRHITPSLSIDPRALSNGGARNAAFDYKRQTLWMSANVHDMLPTSIAKAWPSAVRLSAGRRAPGGGAASDYIVGLDLDAAALPGNNAAWVQIKNALHAVRLPGPALVMGSNGTRAVGLYW